ncbi:hypothetical protein KUTeg_002293 [Tegillarca granosa]|uniref:PABS domain-containing protein n=1 Tax=Tegillarca granosa TaxID=220873 RepID=A0ABQ9FTX0_TEGGR|nr:hypothetical protein KUTeg_002293 [Tegillarca granosa]
MLAHLPLNAHPNPKNVLIIGGGDGGVLREVVKHPQVDKVDMCEIDEKVIEVSKKYLPNMSCGFESSKLNLHIGDGFEYMKNHQGKYDVIITDSSDPIGECLWLHLDLIKGMQEFCHSLYPVVDYCFTTIPTYPSGQIGFILCSLNPDTVFSEPLRKFTREEMEKLNLRYYNEDIHRAAFILPEFARKVLRDQDGSNDNAKNGH